MHLGLGPKLEYEGHFLKDLIDESVNEFPQSLPRLEVGLTRSEGMHFSSAHEVIQLFLNNITTAAVFGVAVGAAAKAGGKAVELITTDAYGWVKSLFTRLVKHNSDRSNRYLYGRDNIGVRLYIWSPEKGDKLCLDIRFSKENDDTEDDTEQDLATVSRDLEGFTRIVRPALQEVAARHGLRAAHVSGALSPRTCEWNGFIHGLENDERYSLPSICGSDTVDWTRGNELGRQLVADVLKAPKVL